MTGLTRGVGSLSVCSGPIGVVGVQGSVQSLRHIGGERSTGCERVTFRQVPSLLGRQLEHDFPAFTQAQPLQEPVLLHLQHDTIFTTAVERTKKYVTDHQPLSKACPTIDCPVHF